MELVMLSVRDAKSEAFGRPFFATTVGTAIRSFDDEVNRSAEDSMLNHHPEDFALYQLGSFNDSDGTYAALPVPKLLVQGNEVKKVLPVETKISKV